MTDEITKWACASTAKPRREQPLKLRADPSPLQDHVQQHHRTKREAEPLMPLQPREIDAHQHQHGGIKAQQERDTIRRGATTDSLAGTNSREAEENVRGVPSVLENNIAMITKKISVRLGQFLGQTD